MKKLSFLALSLALAILFAGTGETLPASGASAAPMNSANNELLPSTLKELAQARAATAKYHDLAQALADGYINIDVFVPGQGFHYLKPSLLDGQFEIDKPELLVYALNPQEQTLRLVAVEYAVPISLSAAAPAGFSGEADVWDTNEEFGLWTLHSWIWLKNPHGVFADINPRVP